MVPESIQGGRGCVRIKRALRKMSQTRFTGTKTKADIFFYSNNTFCSCNCTNCNRNKFKLKKPYAHLSQSGTKIDLFFLKHKKGTFEKVCDFSLY